MFSGAEMAKRAPENNVPIYNFDSNSIHESYAATSTWNPSSIRGNRGSNRSRPYAQRGQKRPVSTTISPKPELHPKPQVPLEVPSTITSSEVTTENQSEPEPTYLVCDTNTWMKSLRLITDVLHHQDTVNYNIYIPHIVGIELDKKKTSTNQNTSKLARTAINVRNSYLKANPRVSQQTEDQSRTASTFHYTCVKADDHILAACKMLKSQGKKVEICTKDKNLECDAIANNIKIHPPITPELASKINNSKSKEVILRYVIIFQSLIYFSEMETHYEDIKKQCEVPDEVLLKDVTEHAFLFAKASPTKRRKSMDILRGIQ